MSGPSWPDRGDTIRDSNDGVSDATKRDLLFGVGAVAIVLGVWVSFGLGLALIAAGLFGVAVAVAWARNVTPSA